MTTELERQLFDLKQGDHICLIYETMAEQRAGAIPFLKEGFGRGVRCLYIADDHTVEAIAESLAAAGVDVAREQERGALWMLTKLDSYLKGGKFDPQAMIDFLRSAQTQALADGFAGLRVVGEMTWALGLEVGCDRLIEFEARLHDLLADSRSVILCQYNRTRFNPAVIHDVLRTHPIAILGDLVCPNPYYEPPELVLSAEQQASDEFKRKRVEWWIAQLKRARVAEQERERILERLKQSERRLAEAQQVAHIGSWERDLRTNQVTWSDELYHLFGLPAHEIELSYQLFLNHVVPQDLDRILVLLEEAIREHRPFSFDYRITRADGGVRVLRERGIVMLNEQGEPIRLVGTAQDVTERRRAEEMLEEHQQLVHMVLTTLPVGVLVTDRAADVILANPAFQRIWGHMIVSGRERWAQSKGYWHDSGKRIDPESWASARALSEGRTSLNELIDIETFDGGRRKTIQNSAAPIRNAEGSIVGAVIVNEDVTERVRAQKALRESADRLQALSRRLLKVQEEERRHLARELHDEVGQLLTGLRLLLKTDGDLSSDAAKARLEQARGIVDGLLEKVRGLSFDLRPQALDQLGLLPALLSLFERYTAQTGVLVNLKHQGVEGRFTPEVETTAYRIVQEALTNVARHASVSGVTVRVWADADILGLQIQDRGRSFDPEAALATPRSGGLAGMQERVQLLGGQLTIESHPGAGTQITVELPLHR
jgi:PAS domain S-box-containing protein